MMYDVHIRIAVTLIGCNDHFNLKCVGQRFSSPRHENNYHFAVCPACNAYIESHAICSRLRLKPL
jgi:hypothetical protein